MWGCIWKGLLRMGKIDLNLERDAHMSEEEGVLYTWVPHSPTYGDVRILGISVKE